MVLNVEKFMEDLIKKNPYEVEFHQSVREVLHSIAPFIEKNPRYAENSLLERLVEPERTIMFRVPWVDDQGVVQVNRGWRVEFNSAIGPYKGGIRFAPDVTLGTVKFLGFEMIFKNGLTTLPLGAGKGGADFDCVGKSDGEVMRFCQSYMSELFRHIGPNTDIPAGDIGVGHREIGYMFGQYKRLTNEFTGVLTGKKFTMGGSLIRPEATGYGVTYFADAMLETVGDSVEGKTVAISGYGNVGAFTAEKVAEMGGKIVTASDQYGYIYDPEGIVGERLAFLKDLWVVHRRPIKDYADKFGCQYIENKRPWEVPVDIAIPTSRQNELDEVDAAALLKNGVICVVEGANMPCTEKAIDMFHKAGVLFAPGKAANAGGVAVSGLEMAQNSMHYSWSAEEVDQKLREIMGLIHDTCIEFGQTDKGVNYVNGANIGGFVKVADAMIDLGII
ncbi:NADP-specific glutamate dehydrogenase [Vagococcus elongatus]|uniref:Glutamate dehydrogenase n=1 Tax=Vagococcus elongatus TaxID=180344 RepID=A0A430B4K5_9ENTE|nr:NADP-specific glutamate dehydrogenase [Vagococcus elongatus]RSU15142.1 glutamate dehydrogenase [Vagococcus elongatus]